VTSDAFHITAPDPEGTGVARAVINALEHAGVDRTAVAHINAHATSTPVGDVAEIRALERVFGDHLKNIAISATKSSTGHLLGGAGAIEAAFTVKALATKTLPPTINTTQLDDSIDIDLVTEPRSIGDEPIVAISTSFGFGGHNAVVAFRSV
jgi:3-oxoacyl-[acyl-carrier-protein] synthase II